MQGLAAKRQSLRSGQRQLLETGRESGVTGATVGLSMSALRRVKTFKDEQSPASLKVSHSSVLSCMFR